MAGKACQQDLQAVGHIASVIKNQKDECCCSAVFFSLIFPEICFHDYSKLSQTNNQHKQREMMLGTEKGWEQQWPGSPGKATGGIFGKCVCAEGGNSWSLRSGKCSPELEAKRTPSRDELMSLCDVITGSVSFSKGCLGGSEGSSGLAQCKHGV